MTPMKEQFKHMPEIRRIAGRRHVPKAIKKAAETKRIELGSLKKREDNRRKHSKPGTVPFTAEREKHIVAQQK
jgi:DDB1- and CUL4-associated factor 13